MKMHHYLRQWGLNVAKHHAFVLGTSHLPPPARTPPFTPSAQGPSGSASASRTPPRGAGPRSASRGTTKPASASRRPRSLGAPSLPPPLLSLPRGDVDVPTASKARPARLPHRALPEAERVPADHQGVALRALPPQAPALQEAVPGRRRRGPLNPRPVVLLA